jgi:hypothetical protein
MTRCLCYRILHDGGATGADCMTRNRFIKTTNRSSDPISPSMTTAAFAAASLHTEAFAHAGRGTSMRYRVIDHRTSGPPPQGGCTSRCCHRRRSADGDMKFRRLPLLVWLLSNLHLEMSVWDLHADRPELRCSGGSRRSHHP